MPSRVKRLAASLAGATGITLALFGLMVVLVSNDARLSTDAGPGPTIVLRDVRPAPPPDEPRRREPPPLEKVEQPPPAPELIVPDVSRPRPVAELLRFDTNLPLNGTGPALALGSGAGWASGHLVPLIRIPPAYPYRAAAAGLEGWVRVEFTVTETGAVVEPRVVKSRPSKIFDDAALKAIVRWRFEPRRVDGDPVPVRVVQTFDFNLSDS